MDGKDKLKPLPKPVPAPQIKQVTSPPPIDPDDFELPNREPRQEHGSQGNEQSTTNRPVRYYRGRRPVRGKWISKPSQPSFGAALLILFRRLFKRIVRRFRQSRPSGQTGQTLESKRQARLRKKRRRLYARLTGIAAAGIFTVAFIVFLVVWLTGKNAYEVTLGEEILGYIGLSEDITAADIQAQAVAHLEGSLGAKVRVGSEVKIEAVNTGRDKIIEDSAMLDLISRNFPYEIAATAIRVEGQEIAVFKTLEEAQAVERKLQEPYWNDNTKEAEFLEEFIYETKYVNTDELNVPEDALLQLDKQTRVLIDYSVESGDTLDAIAKRNNTTIDKLCADTPNLTALTILQPGDIIKVETMRPYLSVRTIEELVREVPIPMPTETIENPSQLKSYLKVTQQGREGKEEVTIRRTLVNGILEKQEEEIGRVKISDPVTQIEEVGTMDPQPR